MAREPELAHDDRPQQPGDVGRARDPVARPELLGDARAADALAPLEHHHAPARAREIGGRHEPVVSRADHRDVVTHRAIVGARSREVESAATARTWRRRGHERAWDRSTCVALAILLIAALRGLSLGLIREAFSIGALVGGRDRGAASGTSRSCAGSRARAEAGFPRYLAPWIAGALLAVGVIAAVAIVRPRDAPGRARGRARLLRPPRRRGARRRRGRARGGPARCS